MKAIRELAAHLPDELVVVDIGCRWGFATGWDVLGPHVSLIGFDADESEIERLRHEFADRPEMHFHARTLGAERGRATLMRTRNASGTSLFRPDEARLEHLPAMEETRVADETIVDVSTLDGWLKAGSIARIDALKLDTQGSELDILRGSLDALETIRHVEVEVALNELFAGAPLFGEVDAFMRAHGFALWRFRDLVHYALREAPDPPPVTEHFWYQGVPHPIESPGGQLIWCNAHFVRRDLYDTSVTLDSEVRLRDACLMQALGFYDLVVVALKRLVVERTCPPEVSASAQRMLAEMRESARPPDLAGTPPARGAVGALLDRARARLRRPADQNPD